MFTNKQQVKDMIKRNHNYVYDDRLTLNELIEHVEQQYLYDASKNFYNTTLYSSTEPIKQLTYYESEYEQITVTFIEDRLNGLVPHISNNDNVSTEVFLDEKFIIEDERHMYLYDDTIFKSGELIYKYTDGIQHTNTLDVSLDCLIDDIFQHVHPERLKVYYKYDGQELMLFNGFQLLSTSHSENNNDTEKTDDKYIECNYENIDNTKKNSIETKSDNTKLLETSTWCMVTLTIFFIAMILLQTFFI